MYDHKVLYLGLYAILLIRSKIVTLSPFTSVEVTYRVLVMTSIFVLMFLFVKFQLSAFLFNVHVPFVAHGVLVSLCTIKFLPVLHL
jgi:hypothetical protein